MSLPSDQTTMLNLIHQILPPLLSLQLAFGSQGGLTARFTPKVYEFTRKKALRAVSSGSLYWIVPTRNVDSHMQIVGMMMGTASVLVAIPRTRIYGAALTMLLAGMGAWSQRMDGFNYQLPIINFCLAGLMGWTEGRRMGWF